MSEMKTLDQYLKQRKSRWYYARRVPNRYAEVDKRRLIKYALKISSREVARARRNLLAEADGPYLSSLATSRTKGSNASAVSRYRAAKARPFARGYIYKPVEDLSAQNKISEVIDRIRALEGSFGTRQPFPETDALLGTAPKASIPISEAFELYCDKISIGDQKGKSPDQRRNWRKVKARAVQNLIRLRGEKPTAEIDRFTTRASTNGGALELTRKTDLSRAVEIVLIRISGTCAFSLCPTSLMKANLSEITLLTDYA